jgi:AcrR family transcriptional regulator
MRTSVERGTRERILDVAETSLGEHGYHGTRLHDIARHVGIQKASLFHYFASKEELYRAVLEEGFGETEQIIKDVLASAGSPVEKIRTLVEAYVDMVAAHPERTKILLRQSLGDAPVGYEPPDSPQRLLDIVARYVAEGQQANLFVPIDPLALVMCVVGVVAFFFTSAPVLAPDWFDKVRAGDNAARVKRLVVSVVERCLVEPPPADAATMIPAALSR